MALILDTGATLALLDANDRHHLRCVRLVDETNETLVIPSATLYELDYWVRNRLTVEVWQTFAEDVAAGGYRLEPVTEADLLRSAALERQYADADLDFVDAAVIALCERLGEPKVATLDRRDFAIVRPRHVPSLELLPH